MPDSVNYNHLHKPSGGMISEGCESITVGDLRNVIAEFPDDTEIVWGICDHGIPLKFYRFKRRGEKVLGIELNNDKNDL